MKRVLTLMVALLMVLLCACGGEAATAQPEQAPVETTAEGYYVQEKTLDDGTVVTIYRDGGPEGIIVKGFANYTDGTYSEETYDNKGNLEYMIWSVNDGSVFESYFYPSGNVEKSIAKMEDGSYSETHYMDNGTYDEKNGTTSGTVTYQKYISPDGQVDEQTYDVEADGTSWSTFEWEDGTIVKTHFGANGARLEEIQDNEKTGDHTEITYYENGNEKTRDSHHGEGSMRIYLEYYENGSVAYSLMESEDGYKREEKFNEAGYTVYYYDSGVDMEFFANDAGELVKYVSGGTVYEGDAIPSDARSTFNQVRIVPAEDVSTVQNADGSSNTTTTYADGDVVTNGITSDGSSVYESVSANGDRYYEEYYPSGTLKLVILETAETYQEIHYDEETYYTYYLQRVPGYELEITCDETGKVNKVLLNGVEQTDIESIVKDMFFRSW